VIGATTSFQNVNNEQLSPTSFDFGSHPIGSTTQKAFSVLNVSTSFVTFAPNIFGSGSAAYSATSGCPSGVGPGGSCTIVVSFRPTAATTYIGTLFLNPTPNVSADVASLSGAGALPRITGYV